jgi:hypothetical protein
MADKIWSEGDQAKTATGSFVVSPEAETSVNSVLNLKPQTDSQRSARARAIKELTDVGTNAPAALHAVGQCDTGAIPGATRVLACHYICKLQPFRAAQPDCRVRFFVCAFSASGALFLIFELDRPFTGLMSVSDTALRQALAPL